MPTPEEEKAKRDAEMEETKKKADAEKEEEKNDADAGQKLDKVLACLDSLSKRMDAMEEDDKKKADAEKAEEKEVKKDDDDDSKKKDADEKPEFLKKEEVAADKKRKDEDDDAKKKADADMAKKMDDVTSKIADVEARLPKAIADADYHALTDAQAKADAVFQVLGQHAPRFMQGEDLIGYRKRLASALKVH